jgi:ABC-type sulfate/molybdate transport systems ATPase subunit
MTEDPAADLVTPVVVAHEVRVRLGRTDILHDVDFSIAPGEVVALLGPNGAGKTTLLGALSGRLPVAAGQVERHGRVASVLQTPSLVGRSAVANVELALAWWRVPRPQRRRRAMQALNDMQAGHLAKRRADTLSGGEQRRVHLARAVAVSPDLLLLDEPFDGLDPQAHESLRDDTATVLRAADSAVVIVLHDRADAWAMADRIVVLINGRVQADGAPQDILDHPPTPDVARLLGYDGELSTDSGLLLTRPTHVSIDPSGELPATVLRAIGVEDGMRLELQTGRGRVWTRHAGADVRAGDDVTVTIRGGAEFPVTPEDATAIG